MQLALSLEYRDRPGKSQLKFERVDCLVLSQQEIRASQGKQSKKYLMGYRACMLLREINRNHDERKPAIH